MQLSGLAVIVTAYIATNIVPPEKVKALIAAGSIGVVTLVFAQIFHFLKDFKEEERASLIFKLFVTFLVFILLLVGALAYLLVKPTSLPERIGEGSLPTNVVVASRPLEILFFEARSHDTPGRPVNILQLCYEVLNADRVEINNNIGNVAEAGKHCIDVSVTRTTNYILKAKRGDQTVSKEIIVTPERGLPAQIGNFRATPRYVNADKIGEPIQLCYCVMNTRSARIEPEIGAVSVAKGEQCLSVNPKGTTTYTLSALGIQGYTSRKRVTVLVKQSLPEISEFRPSAANIVPGEEVALNYLVENAQKAEIDHGIGEIDISPRKSPEENRSVVVRPQRSSMYTLTGTGFDGRKVRLHTFVWVGEIPRPVKIVDFTATL